MRLPASLSPCLLVFFLVGCAKAPPEPYPIGHLTARNPVERALGGSADQALILAVEEVNIDMLFGRPVVVLQPDVNGPDTFPSVATRLIAVNKVNDLLASTDALQTEKLCRLAQQYQLPLVATCGLPAPTLQPFAFSVGLAPAQQGTALAQCATGDLKQKKAALLVDTRGLVNQAAALAFAEEFRKAEGAKLQQWTFADAEELKKVVKKTRDAEVGLVAFAGAASDLPAVRECLDVNAPILLLGEEEDPRVPILDPHVYRATAFVVDGSLPRAVEFGKKYTERFKRAPDVPAALAYDAARVLFEGLRRAKVPQGTKVRDELQALKDFESLTGPLSFDKEHRTKRPLFVVRRDDKGQVKLVKKVDPS